MNTTALPRNAAAGERPDRYATWVWFATLAASLVCASLVAVPG